MNDNKTIELNEYELIKIIRYYYLTYEHKKIYGESIRRVNECGILDIEAFYKEKNIIYGINGKKKVSISLNFGDIKEIINKVLYSNYEINVNAIDIELRDNSAYQYLNNFKCLKIGFNEIEQEKDVNEVEDNKETGNIFQKVRNKIRKKTLISSK